MRPNRERTEKCKSLLLPHNSQQIRSFKPVFIRGICIFTKFKRMKQKRIHLSHKTRNDTWYLLIELCGEDILSHHILFVNIFCHTREWLVDKIKKCAPIRDARKSVLPIVVTQLQLNFSLKRENKSKEKTLFSKSILSRKG